MYIRSAITTILIRFNNEMFWKINNLTVVASAVIRFENFIQLVNVECTEIVVVVKLVVVVVVVE